MSDETETTAAAADAAQPATEATAAAAESADARVATLEGQVIELRDQLLRTLAEMENLRRRTEREIADSRTYAVTSFARDVLGVGDNLARALAAVPEEARAAADEAVKTLLDGVEMTERELLKAMEKHGVRKVDPAGERFDPNFHQAMFEVPNPDVPNGTVVQVVQAGYKIGDRVLRPALVGVGRGGPKPGAAPAAEAAAADPQKVDRTV